MEAPASEAAAVAPLRPLPACLYFSMITSITLRIRGTARLTPFSMKKYVTTWCQHRTLQNPAQTCRPADFFFFFEQAVYILQTYVN